MTDKQLAMLEAAQRVFLEHGEPFIRRAVCIPGAMERTREDGG